MATLSRTKVAENGTIKAGADREQDKNKVAAGRNRTVGGHEVKGRRVSPGRHHMGVVGLV